ncbi:hypothetical protein [Paraburkholderia sp.]|uniref:hypothetical protein n=1 Tax=Paraburkholderia sp. TaxID=1926495 RepID=UPI003C7B9E4B
MAWTTSGLAFGVSVVQGLVVSTFGLGRKKLSDAARADAHPRAVTRHGIYPWHCLKTSAFRQCRG